MAMEPRSSLRYSSAAALADDLERVVQGRPPRARPLGNLGPLSFLGAVPYAVRRWPWVALLLVIASVCVPLGIDRALDHASRPELSASEHLALAATSSTRYEIERMEHAVQASLFGSPVVALEARMLLLDGFARERILLGQEHRLQGSLAAMREIHGADQFLICAYEAAYRAAVSDSGSPEMLEAHRILNQVEADRRRLSGTERTQLLKRWGGRLSGQLRWAANWARVQELRLPPNREIIGLEVFEAPVGDRCQILALDDRGHLHVFERLGREYRGETDRSLQLFPEEEMPEPARPAIFLEADADQDQLDEIVILLPQAKGGGALVAVWGHEALLGAGRWSGLDHPVDHGAVCLPDRAPGGRCCSPPGACLEAVSARRS